MKCEQYKDLFTDFINKDLSIPERENMEQHLAACPGCTAQLLAMQQLWDIMGTIETPEPSAHLKVKFNAMLSTYKQEVAEQKMAFGKPQKPAGYVYGKCSRNGLWLITLLYW